MRKKFVFLFLFALSNSVKVFRTVASVTSPLKHQLKMAAGDIFKVFDSRKKIKMKNSLAFHGIRKTKAYFRRIQ